MASNICSSGLRWADVDDDDDEMKMLWICWSSVIDHGTHFDQLAFDFFANRQLKLS